MIITVTEKDGLTRLAINGMLDSSSAPQLQNRTESILDRENINLLVDMTDMDYISSQGIRAILTLIKAVTVKKGNLQFTGIKPEVMEILDMSGISEAMTIV